MPETKKNLPKQFQLEENGSERTLKNKFRGIEKARNKFL